jgi:flagellar biosynthesis/type III secretory pathway protein FliH
MPEFQTLASLLIPRETVAEEIAPVMLSEPPVMLSLSKHPPDDFRSASEARLFYAHLREELEDRVRALLERIARDVLARELQLAQAAIGAIVERAYREYAACQPLRVRLHPDDAAVCNTGPLPIFEDSSLVRGDAVLELRTGAVDLRLETRLHDALDPEWCS